MSIFQNPKHQIAFSQPDPLGGGLAEEIAAEQAESDAIVLEDSDTSSLSDQWSSVIEEVKKDPDWFTATVGDE